MAMGIGEAGMFPACYELYGRWVPAAARALTQPATRTAPLGRDARPAVSWGGPASLA